MKKHLTIFAMIIATALAAMFLLSDNRAAGEPTGPLSGTDGRFFGKTGNHTKPGLRARYPLQSISGSSGVRTGLRYMGNAQSQ